MNPTLVALYLGPVDYPPNRLALAKALTAVGRDSEAALCRDMSIDVVARNRFGANPVLHVPYDRWQRCVTLLGDRGVLVSDYEIVKGNYHRSPDGVAWTAKDRYQPFPHPKSYFRDSDGTESTSCFTTNFRRSPWSIWTS